MAKRDKYPPYPGSGRDYAVRHSAKIALRQPNKVICIYCHAQALSEDELKGKHQPDCPAKDHKED